MLLYGFYVIISFEPTNSYDGIPRWLAAFGRMGEFEAARPNFMLLMLIPDALIAVPIAIRMVDKQEGN